MKILRLFFLILTTSTLFAGLDDDFIEAAEKGNIKRVTELLNHGANVHAWDDEALRAAARYGYTEIVRLLLDRGANVHADHEAPLIKAAQNGHIEIVRLLLDHDADIHVGDYTGRKNDIPLIKAAEYGHTDTVRLLLDRGANIHTDHEAPLIKAAQNGHIEIVRLLLNRGADIHPSEEDAFYVANRKGHHCIKAMLQLCYMRGFEEFREAPLAFIEDQKNAKRPIHIQLMLRWSIILNQEEAFNQLLNTLIETEGDLEGQIEVDDELFFLTDTLENYRMTALMYTALFGNESMCAKLVHAGAKINLKNRWEKTAIQLADDAGYRNISSYLLMQLKGKNIF